MIKEIMCKVSKTTTVFEESWVLIREKTPDFMVDLQDEKDSPRTQVALVFVMSSKISHFLKAMEAYISEQIETGIVRVEENKEWFKEYAKVRKVFISVKKYLKNLNYEKKECHYTTRPWYHPSLDRNSAVLLSDGKEICDAFVHVTDVFHKMAKELKELKESAESAEGEECEKRETDDTEEKIRDAFREIEPYITGIQLWFYPFRVLAEAGRYGYDKYTDFISDLKGAGINNHLPAKQNLSAIGSNYPKTIPITDYYTEYNPREKPDYVSRSAHTYGKLIVGKFKEILDRNN